ncbi:MAG: hypothetical protein IJC32_05060 [Clostridia bacterium]|nr:hypothetical protein [Clostridia bacterium]
MSDDKRSPIEEALATLQSNPEIITKIADAIGMDPPAQTSQAEADAEKTQAASEIKIPDGLLEKMPLILSALGGSGGSLGGTGKLNLGALMGDPKKTALLRALCPYLSPARRETAETILRLWSVGDVLKGL